MCFKPEYCELAHSYWLHGATSEVPGDFFGVTRSTVEQLDRHLRPTSPTRAHFCWPFHGGQKVARRTLYVQNCH